MIAGLSGIQNQNGRIIQATLTRDEHANSVTESAYAISMGEVSNVWTLGRLKAESIHSIRYTMISDIERAGLRYRVTDLHVHIESNEFQSRSL